MTLHSIGGVLRALPWAFILLQLEVALFCFIAYQVGKRKGLNLRPEVWKQRADELQFQLVQAEERLAAEKRVNRKLEVMVEQLVGNESKELNQRLRTIK